MDILRVENPRNISLAFNSEKMSQILILDQEGAYFAEFSRRLSLFSLDIFCHDFLINLHSN